MTTREKRYLSVAAACCAALFAVLIGVSMVMPRASADATLPGLDHNLRYACTPVASTVTYPVESRLDVAYGDNPSETLDLIAPSGTYETAPLIVWVHGGAFIGGDKQYVQEYMTMLAHHGYAVASINYSLAPDARYPTPVLQLGQAYEFLRQHALEYGIDDSRVVVGGDSAGAQIALQFAMIQTEPEYAARVGISPGVTLGTLKGVISFSGLLNMRQFDETTSASVNYAYDQAAAAYFGETDWKTDPRSKDASIVGSVTDSFPPAFIMDGNTVSFENQAQDLANELRGHGVEVELSLYDKSLATLGHDYQFSLETEQARQVYRDVVGFLAQRTCRQDD